MKESKTILLVEDEALIAMDEAAVLEKNGYTVVTAYNAKKAIAKARDESIDLILMDIDLGSGKMDGTEAAEEILRERELPIVFLTSHAEKEMVEKVKGITRYGYVLKNAGEFVLIESISMAFELFEAYQKDITKQKEEEEQLELYRQVVESTDDIIVLFNKDSETVVCNEAFKRFVKEYTGKEPRPGINSYKYLEKDKYQEWQKEIHNVLEGKTVRKEDPVTLLNGEKKIYDVFLSPVRKDGEIIGFSEISRDITKYKKIERELQISQERMEIILNSIPEDIYIVDIDTYEILFMNEQMKRSFKNAKVGDICYEVFRGVGAPCSHCTNRQLVEHQEDKEYIITWEGYNPINSAWYLNYDTLIPWTEGKPVRMQIAADITDRKNAEDALKESEEKYKNIFDNSFISLWEQDISQTREKLNALKKKGVTDFKAYFAEHPTLVKDFIKTVQIVDVNEAGITLYGANNKEELLGPLSNLFNYSEKSLAFFTEELIAIVQGIRNLEREGRGKLLDGRIVDILIKSTIPTAAEKHNNMLVAITDITARKQTEEELKNLNEQKDILMKELNHRVKNNLLMVSSLVSLKNAETGEEVDLSDLENRIDAIQLIHEKLNQSEDISKISLQEYIEDLVASIYFKISRKPVKTTFTIENVRLPTKLCVSLGLIINEIATNAIKYGFSGNEDAEFSVEFSRDKETEEYRLILSNSGNPFPQDVSFPNSGGSGLGLVSALVEQIGGTVELKREPHPVFTIRFPAGDQKK